MRAAITPDAFRSLASEAEMTETIAELVTRKGGRLFHLNDGRRAPELADFPDLVILLPGLVALAELKSQKRGITVGQRQVLSLLQDISLFFGGVVRPEPFPGETSFDDFLAILNGGS